jgi:hypothetical protein
MNCQWVACTNEAVDNVFRALSDQEQMDSMRGEGIVLSISKYHHKRVCGDCLPLARQTYALTQADVDADDTL